VGREILEIVPGVVVEAVLEAVPEAVPAAVRNVGETMSLTCGKTEAR
jgi:hypothetical protein